MASRQEQFRQALSHEFRAVEDAHVMDSNNDDLFLGGPAHINPSEIELYGSSPRKEISVTSVESRAEEVTREVGISLEVIEIMADQTRLPLTNGNALLDRQQFASNPDVPLNINADDYSEDSRP